MTPLHVLRDIMLGGRHSRRTIAAMAAGPSLPTADRWIVQLVNTVPGVRTVRVGKTTWVEWRATPGMRSIK